LGARQLEGQLELTVVAPLVPQRVLKQDDRPVIAGVHVPACPTLVFTASHTALALSFSTCAMSLRMLFDNTSRILVVPKSHEFRVT
jgi:hypothetical protein